MTIAALTCLFLTVTLVLYTYVGYPLILGLLARSRSPRSRPDASRTPTPATWPTVTMAVPVYNEAAQIRETVEHLLRVDYPREKLQILVVSDGSTDGTDDIVREFVDRGVELVRMPVRRGKTAAENAVAPLIRGELVVNTDASVRIRPEAVRALAARFADPTVGLASGRDVSVNSLREEVNSGESGYVGYEMWIRALETRAAGIIGASGCLYAIRTALHRTTLPDNLSRDFAAALIAREHGYRSVSVDEALCLVPRTSSLRKEYRRKVRTMIRGMRTLFFKRHLLSPRRYGLFAWQLFSHKVCRWLAPWALVFAFLAILVLAAAHAMALPVVYVALALAAVAALGWSWPAGRAMPRVLALPAFAVWSNLAALHALVRAPLPQGSAMWEPTRRSRITS